MTTTREPSALPTSADTLVEFNVAGMTCGSCATRVQRRLAKEPGVLDAVVNFATHHATVTLDPATTGPDRLSSAVGAIGYFATYALGNVISGQLWEKATAEIPDLHDQFEQGEFGALAGWLGENLWRHGRKFTPRELVERITGGGLDSEPYLRYLRGKYPLAN